MTTDPFKEYIRHIEPSKKEKGYAWHTAVGLQDVDHLQPSPYLIETALKNIEGKISIETAEQWISQYYEEKPISSNQNRTEEADKVSVRIAKLLSEPAFSFNVNKYLATHKYLFSDIYSHAGKIREFNITKKEWVLDGESVIYGTASELNATLEYDLTQEKKFSYKGLSIDEMIEHLATFIARLWQIHPFAEGNTRTTAIFFIKYLRTLGFQATNHIFAQYSWYFRNALIRANYNNLPKEVYETTEYLIRFLRNLLLNENHLLSNRELHI
ncbi:Fic family protein [Pasteurellaceae bacterium LIM206]|nr:Fic family protein [Pasteurellaceae bacterium LIM206]